MMSDSVTYKCAVCGWDNHWTRDEILRKQIKLVFRNDEQIYSLPCRNPNLRPACPGRQEVAVPKSKW